MKKSLDITMIDNEIIKNIIIYYFFNIAFVVIL